MKPIPLTKPHFDEDEIDEIRAVLDSGWVAGQGPASQRLAAALQAYLGVQHALPVNNCTAALHLAMIALGIHEGDEVIVADYTYPATGHSVLYTGARPVFCDVKKDTFNIDEARIPQLMTGRTKALIAVHAFGNPANMPAIMAIARAHRIKVVEDCACSFGSTLHGTQTGLFGDIGCYSFHARKGITTGEGGAVVTNDAALHDSMRVHSCFGIESAFARAASSAPAIPEFRKLGYNYKLSDINAAIGIAQLRKLDAMATKRRQLATLYRELLRATPLAPQELEVGASSVHQAFVCRAPRRDDLMASLRERGIQTQIGTYSSCIQPVYQEKSRCPVSIELFNAAIALPLFVDMTETDVRTVCSAVEEFYT